MKYILTLAIVFLVSGCAINTINKTKHLVPGMTTLEVKGVMGEPDSTELSNGFLVWKYSLQKAWTGYIPYYLAFDQNKSLIAWQANMDEYYASQSLWLQSLPKQHNINVHSNINHNINGTIDVR